MVRVKRQVPEVRGSKSSYIIIGIKNRVMLLALVECYCIRKVDIVYLLSFIFLLPSYCGIMLVAIVVCAAAICAASSLIGDSQVSFTDVFAAEELLQFGPRGQKASAVPTNPHRARAVVNIPKTMKMRKWRRHVNNRLQAMYLF